MCYSRTKSVTTIALVLVILVSATIKSKAIPASKRLYLKERITSTYPEQLTNPEKKNRKTFSQFGYNLSEFSVPLFPITKFIEQGKFGQQSYSRPNRWKEKNGAIYTCKGGFIDVSHIRAAIDWTVYLTMMILADDKDVALPSEAGTLTVSFRHLDKLTEDDIASMAQKIAFERLVWHEVASWHYHPPYHFIGEQSSTFTPEDTFSTILTGVLVGVPALFLNLQVVVALTSVGTLFAFVLVCGGIIRLQQQRKKATHLKGADIITEHGEKELVPESKFKITYINSKWIIPLLFITAMVLFLKYYPGGIEAFFNFKDDKGIVAWHVIREKVPYLLFTAVFAYTAFLSFIRSFSLIPVLGFLCCTYLLCESGTSNWERFLIWLVIGLLIYFAYGIKKSRLANKE